MLEGLTINYWAVLVSAIASMAIGMFWYSPAVFGKAWMKGMKFKKSDMKKMHLTPGAAMAFGFAASLLTMFVLAIFMQYTQVTTIVHGMTISFWVWLGFVMPVVLGGTLWENKPWKVFLIGASYQLVNFLVAGAILGAWI